MINSFWWGSNRTSGRGINWMRWEKLAMRKEHGGLGFRHFYGFNLAMLGKKGWNLLTNHDTILSKVFKAKYYPKMGFLEATLGHNPSYVWRSIHASQVVVRRGLKWSIGDGSKINVWRVSWLKDDENPFVTSAMIASSEELCVSDLMQQNERKWNEDLIHQVFNERDAKEILKIPISCTRDEDTPIWRFSNNGTYTVRSAYYQLMEVIIDNNHLKVEGEWLKIWKLKVPNRVKI
ncbi:putative ribonuclease H protein, partial [Trifolium medium]|nr:putative ribonuclease H protein [Trifolium medium]